MPNWNNGQNNPAQAPVGVDAGSLWWNGGLSQLEVFNGTIWTAINAPGATLNASLHAGQGLTYLSMVTGSIGGSANLGASLGGSTNGVAAMTYDVINNRMWVWNGSSWKSVAFS